MPERALPSDLCLKFVPKASAMAPAPREAPPMPREAPPPQPPGPTSPSPRRKRDHANSGSDSDDGSRHSKEPSDELPPEGLVLQTALSSVLGNGPTGQVSPSDVQSGESTRRAPLQLHAQRSDIGTMGVQNFAFADPCEDPEVQDKLLNDLMTSPGQLIFLQSVPPPLFDRIKRATSNRVSTEAESNNRGNDEGWSLFIMGGDSEHGMVVLGRASMFTQFSDTGTEYVRGNKWVVWYGTLHLRQPLCNIVALPVATVMALSAACAQGVIEVLEQRNVRLFGMQFARATDVPEHNGDMQVLAWQPHMADGLAYVAPAVLCALGPVSYVQRLHTIDDRANWPSLTSRHCPLDYVELSDCHNLKGSFKVTSTACGQGMQVLPCSIEKAARMRFREVNKLMAFMGSVSRRTEQRFQKKHDYARAGRGKGKPSKGGGKANDRKREGRNGNTPLRAHGNGSTA